MRFQEHVQGWYEVFAQIARWVAAWPASLPLPHCVQARKPFEPYSSDLLFGQIPEYLPPLPTRLLSLLLSSCRS